MYHESFNDRYAFWTGQLNPEVGGQSQPILTELIDERLEFEKLRESARKARMADKGEMEPDADTVLFMQNVGGAQQRLGELTRKFSEEA